MNRDARLFTRSGNDWTAKLPHLAAAWRSSAGKHWLDGEIVVPDPTAAPASRRCRTRSTPAPTTKIVYYVFDAPFLDGKDMRQLPLKERKNACASRQMPPNIRFSDDLTGSAREVLDHACKLKLEGLIGKEAGSVYVAGRTKSWIKLKCRQRQDFVIVGLHRAERLAHGFGALLSGLRQAAPPGLRRQGRHRLRREMLSSLTRKFAPLKARNRRWSIRRARRA